MTLLLFKNRKGTASFFIFKTFFIIFNKKIFLLDYRADFQAINWLVGFLLHPLKCK